MTQRILIAGIVCLFPLLVYCLVLIGLNARHRASLIPGTWDFVGVLLATSGFLLGGVPLILAGINSNWRRFVLSGGVSDWRGLTGEGDARALGAWALIFITIVAGSASLIFTRRNVSVIYNADTDHVWDALEWIFGRLGVVWKRWQNSYELKQVGPSIRHPWVQSLRSGEFVNDQPATIPEPRRSNASYARLQVRILPSSRNVTLVWEGDVDGLRGQVESELSQLLPNLRAQDNPALGWLMTVAMGLFGTMVCAMIFAIILAIQGRTAI